MEASRFQSWINLLAGVWVVFSPWILDFWRLTTPTWNNVIIGALVVVLATSRLWGDPGTWPSWTNVVLGIWLLISPWVLAFSSFGMPTGNDVILGIIIGVFAIWGASVQRAASTPTFTSASPSKRDRRRRR